MKHQSVPLISISISVIVLLAVPSTRSHHTHATCGDRIGNGTVICNIGANKIKVIFDAISHCTHVSVDAKLQCHNEVCEPVLTKDAESMIRYFLTLPNIPVGLFIIIDSEAANYLYRRSRRDHSAGAIASFMRSNSLSFAHFLEYTWEPGFKNHVRRNSLDLIEELSSLSRDEDHHELNWHIGMILELHGSHFAAKYDFDDLAEFVDVFILAPRRHEEIIDGKFYVGPAFPLTSKKHESGSYKFALDLTRHLIRPECLIVQIEMSGKKYVPINKGVEVFPGSQGEHHFIWVPYRDICRRQLDESDCRMFWDGDSSTPFANCGDDFLTYENATSVKLKVDLIKTYKVKGLQARSLMNDDFEGTCNQGPLPLLRAMKGIREPYS